MSWIEQLAVVLGCAGTVAALAVVGRRQRRRPMDPTPGAANDVAPAAQPLVDGTPVDDVIRIPEPAGDVADAPPRTKRKRPPGKPADGASSTPAGKQRREAGR